MTKEVLKLSLEALEESWHLTPKPDYVRAAITAIREALAQPEQEREKAQSEEREACANKVEVFARKWWSIHCDTNKHKDTTRKAHDDFCTLQAMIRARSNT